VRLFARRGDVKQKSQAGCSVSILFGMTTITIRFYIERSLSVVARSAGHALLHVRHGDLIVLLNGRVEPIVAFGTLQPFLPDVKIVAVHDIPGGA
jgi:hypothetical protein